MTNERYTLIQRLLHWLIALLVIGALGAGMLLEELPNGDFKNQLYATHKATGILILLLMGLRVLARVLFGAPALTIEMPGWQRVAAAATHAAFYLLLLAMPLVGWAATSAYPAPVPFFGIIDVPPLIPADRALSEQLFEIHELMGKLLIALVVLHVGAALHHAVIRKDGLLSRMGF